MSPDAQSATVQKSQSASPTSESRGGLPAERVPSGPRVLIVDDNDELCEALAAALADEGVCVQTASGGLDAANLVDAGHFDALVVDLIMPGQHGLALLADLREKEGGRLLPAVVLSGLPDGDTRDHARALVAKLPRATFLDKPATPRKLLVALGQLLAAS